MIMKPDNKHLFYYIKQAASSTLNSLCRDSAHFRVLDIDFVYFLRVCFVMVCVLSPPMLHYWFFPNVSAVFYYPPLIILIIYTPRMSLFDAKYCVFVCLLPDPY